MTRFTKCIGIGFALIGCVVVKLLWDEHALVVCRSLIESHYRPQLSLLEFELNFVREPDYSSTHFADSLIRVAARDERLARALSAPEIFCASWSREGRGEENLKGAPSGRAYTRPWRVAREPSLPVRICSWLGEWFATPPRGDRSPHTVYRSFANDGTKLVIFEGWVNRTDLYRIAFTRAAIDTRLKSQ